MGTDAGKHRYFEDMAVAHVLGGLDESDGRVFRSHLLQCPDCRTHVGELRALAHDLADVERDERRVRSAKSVETKRREDADQADEDDDPLPAPVASRVPRLLVLVGVLALLGLAGWNFTLRNSLANQEAIVATVTDAAELLEFGEEVAWQAHADGVDASLRMDGDRLVLLVTGLADGDTTHAIYQLDGDDDVVASEPVEVRDGRLYYLVPLLADSRRLVVTRPDQALSDHPAGQGVLEATLPADR